MKIIWFLFTFFLFTSASPLAARDDQSVEVKPQWNVGEKLKYEITKQRIRTRGGAVSSKLTVRSDLNIEVLKKEKDGFIVSVNFGKPTYDDPRLMENPIVKKTGEVNARFRIELKVDLDGEIVDVVNWRQYQKACEEYLAVILDEMKAAGTQDSILSAIEKQVRAMTASKALLLQFCARDLQLLIMALGWDLELGKAVVFPDMLPTPFGGGMLVTKAEITLKNVDRSKGLVTIGWTQTADPKSASTVLEKMGRDMAKSLGQTIKQGDPISANIHDEAEIVIEFATGWVQKAVHKRTVKVNDLSHEEMTRLERKK